MPAVAAGRPRRRVLPRFSIDSRNQVLYQPAAARGRLSAAVVMDGAWHVTRSHHLTFNFRRISDRSLAEALPEHAFLKADIIGAGADSLSLAWERDQAIAVDRQQLRLSGRWQADAFNRLSFLVERAKGGEDRCIFGGGWELGPHHELQYRYRLLDGSGHSQRREHALSFEGAWDVTGRDRLVYRLSGSTRSVFEFQASLQSPALSAREGRMTYQVGIGAGAGRISRRVTLFGRWKLNRDLSVAFEVPYAAGRVETIRFEGAWAFGPRNHVQVALTGRNGRPLGVTVTFSRDLAPDRRLFLQLRRQAEERAVIAGMTVRF